MAETDNPYEYSPEESPVETRPRKPGADMFTLIIGIVTLMVSGYVLSNGASWLRTFDLRWVIAGGAVLIGVLMLGASFRSGRRE